ncbi:MAG: glutamate-5-semialdehyde dehydrogenase [Clostridia bacterium]|nr:glutamate-5-semialdehyde dehydrogenase [Clostridia bacterium]
MINVKDAGKRAKMASRSIMLCHEEQKNEALRLIADALLAHSDEIIEENKKDIENARERGMKESLIDRLMLNGGRIKALAESVIEITRLEDPIGEVVEEWERPNGLTLKKIRVPMGVIGIIYEARPNVTVDAAVLCLKAGSSALLRGGSDAINSNKCLVKVIKEALGKTEISPDAVMLCEDTARESAVEMMKMNEYLDVLIPRGGAGLIRSVVENATVPVIETGTGNCHIYVDESADIEMAKNILINAKTQRTGVCNAAETLLVNKNIASVFLPVAKEALSEKGCRILGCERTREIIECEEATDKDFATEFLDLIISVKVVENVEEAIEHIERYSTHHSEAIITENGENAKKFLREVNSAAVYHNASTRFTDGGEFGFGAEMGISTQKLHARGPMGLKEITSYKFVVEGNGQVR